MLTPNEQRVLERYWDGKVVQQGDRKTLSRLSSAGMVEWGYTLSDNQAKATAKASSRGRKAAEIVGKGQKKKPEKSSLSKLITFISDWGGV